MLTSRLQRAQLELGLHRQWLTCFVTQHRCAHIACPPVLRKRAEPLHPLPPQRLQRNATTFQGPRKHKLRKRDVVKTGKIELPKERELLRLAVAEYRIKDAIKLYHALEDKSWLNKHDFRLIAQCLATTQRRRIPPQNPVARREETEELVAFGEELANDLKRGVLRPLPQGCIHLLGFFKEVGLANAGLRFWEWLREQDAFYVNVDVYGAAIELLAVCGRPLSDLEELYQEALTRFPSNFAEYHLSSEAIVPDRDRAVHLPGLPVVLLQGILTARLLSGDIKNAYLALDTVLRLLPDQTPARFFYMFLSERSAVEAYTVLAIACRAGIVLPTNFIIRFLSAMRQASEGPESTPVRHSTSIRSSLSLMYLHHGAGGTLTTNMINQLGIGITQFLRLPGVAALETKQKKALVRDAMDTIRAAFELFARLGVKPALAVFNSIITNLAGFGHSKSIVAIALADAKALGLEPNEVTRRSILTAAGLLKDEALISKSWRELVQARMNKLEPTDSIDWHCFMKACHHTGCIDLVSLHFERLSEDMSEELQGAVVRGIEDGVGHDLADTSEGTADVAAISTELQKIKGDLQVFMKQVKDGRRVQNYHGQRLPMTMFPVDQSPSVPDQEVRRLYDDLTTEQKFSGSTKVATAEMNSGAATFTPDTNPAAPPPAEESLTPTLSPTGIPFGELRYENWKTLNWLLETAEEVDQLYLKQVDEAIAAGVSPPRREAAWVAGLGDEIGSYGLSDLASEQETRQERATSEEEVESWREHVLKLRNRAL